MTQPAMSRYLYSMGTDEIRAYIRKYVLGGGDPVEAMTCVLCRHTVREHDGLRGVQMCVSCDCCSRPGSIAVAPKPGFYWSVEGA